MALAISSKRPALRLGAGSKTPVSKPRVQLVRSSQQSAGVEPTNDAPQPPQNVCKTCGVDLSAAPKGCDGEGRIIGGLGAVPGFGWWPIKAYKPCSALNAAGVGYVRKGQITNDVLFGGVSLGPAGSKSLQEMKKTAQKGIKID